MTFLPVTLLGTEFFSLVLGTNYEMFVALRLMVSPHIDVELS